MSVFYQALTREEIEEIRREDGYNEGLAEGKLEGKKEGKLEGEYEKSREIAKSLKNEGLSIELIEKTTGLSEEEIEKL